MNQRKEIGSTNTVEVVIAGEVVTLKSGDSADYVQKVAHYIDRKIVTIQKEKKIVSFNSFLKTLLVAINIADDLFKEIDKNELLSNQLDGNNEETENLKLQNETLQEQIRLVEAELAEAKVDLDKYIEAFDKQERYNRQVYKFRK